MNANAEVRKQTFEEYGRAAAKRFLKTAIVIDDDIIAPTEPAEIGDVEEPDFLAREQEPPPVAAGKVEDEVPAGQEGAEPEPPSELQIKPLADAFLDKQIVCGVLKPIPTDDDDKVVARAVRAAEVADIVIVDWYLRRGDSTLALRILSEILKGDRSLKGRLRSILVYTSAIPLNERRDELEKHLKNQGIECTPAEKDVTLIEAEDCRIRFVQKLDGDVGYPVESLPKLAVEEFSRLSSGLLSNFALLGIGALRDATHHLLATFDRRLDPAFVGHRMLLKDTDGARGLAMALFMLQIKGILSLPEHLGTSLNNDELEAWFDDRFSFAEADERLNGLGVERAALRRGLLGGEGKPKDLHPALFIPEAQRLAADAKKIEEEFSRDFARLATFVREPKGFNPLPADWLPTLTLGSVVKQTIGQNTRYLMCVQPLCDTVRVEGERYFPFIELVEGKSDKNTENLPLQDGSNTIVVRVNSKAGARHYEKFKPDAVTASVRAASVVEGGNTVGYTFTGAGGNYEWLGDVDAMKAQRIAVDLSGTLARVGIDEYEWLRRGGAA